MATKNMHITVLGCGTSVGVPMIGMQGMKQFKNPKNCRGRASVLIEPFGRPGPAILIDTSPDFREQAIRFFPRKNRGSTPFFLRTRTPIICTVSTISARSISISASPSPSMARPKP